MEFSVLMRFNSVPLPLRLESPQQTSSPTHHLSIHPIVIAVTGETCQNVPIGSTESRTRSKPSQVHHQLPHQILQQRPSGNPSDDATNGRSETSCTAALAHRPRDSSTSLRDSFTASHGRCRLPKSPCLTSSLTTIIPTHAGAIGNVSISELCSDCTAMAW